MERTLTGVEGGGFDISVVATLSPSSEIPVRGIVDRTIDSWSRTNAIPVSPDARDLITSGVVEAKPQLDEFFRAQLAFRADTGSLLDWLVRDYCFDLRDRKLQSTHVGKSLRPFRLPYSNGFFASGGTPVKLDASVVHGFSFVQYLARLLSRITPSQPVGDLLVVSLPDQQLVTIDGATGEDYFTDRSFVASVGSHTVAVSTCKEVLVVTAYEKAKLSCPKR
jgi:hypothetical protein